LAPGKPSLTWKTGTPPQGAETFAVGYKQSRGYLMVTAGGAQI
jgi:hypothetical protein